MSESLPKIVRLQLGSKTPKYNDEMIRISLRGKDTVRLSNSIPKNAKDISLSEETGETPPNEMFFDLPRKRSRKDSDFSSSKGSEMSSRTSQNGQSFSSNGKKGKQIKVLPVSRRNAQYKAANRAFRTIFDDNRRRSRIKPLLESNLDGPGLQSVASKMSNGKYFHGWQLFYAVKDVINEKMEDIPAYSTDWVNAKEYRVKFCQALKPFLNWSFDSKNSDLEQWKLQIEEMMKDIQKIKEAHQKRLDPAQRPLTSQQKFAVKELITRITDLQQLTRISKILNPASKQLPQDIEFDLDKLPNATARELLEYLKSVTKLRSNRRSNFSEEKLARLHPKPEETVEEILDRHASGLEDSFSNSDDVYEPPMFHITEAL